MSGSAAAGEPRSEAEAGYSRVKLDNALVAAHATPPPVPDGRLRELPLRLLPWQDFERLLIALAADVDELVDVRRYGVDGQAQHGIDIIGFSRAGGPAHAYQAKQVQVFTKSHLAAAVTAFAEGRRPFDASRLVLAVAANANQTSVLEGLDAARRDHPGLTIELWDASRINDLLRSRPAIVQVFFGDQVAQRFCLGAPPPVRRRRTLRVVLAAAAGVVALLAAFPVLASGWRDRPFPPGNQAPPTLRVVGFTAADPATVEGEAYNAGISEERGSTSIEAVTVDITLENKGDYPAYISGADLVFHYQRQMARCSSAGGAPSRSRRTTPCRCRTRRAPSPSRSPVR